MNGKNINFQITVPAWARWITVDKFGVVECWQNEPAFRPNWMEQDGRWINKVSGKRKELMQYSSQCCRGWKKTLREL